MVKTKFIKVNANIIIMERNLRIKCKNCGYWNKMKVEKTFLEQPTSQEKVMAYIPMYRPLKVTKCKKCGNIIGMPTDLIRIVRGHK